jgi:hypothetical protein
MKYEPEAFSWKHDRQRSTEVYEQWAERVWGEESANCPEMASERDYYLGFRDGFVDYVWAGGNGEPPPVPPRHLWNVMRRSPDGKRRADLWFDGYRHGARVARIGGYREMGTIRTSLVGLTHDAHDMGYPNDAMGPQLPGRIEPVPPEQVLPEPPVAQSIPATDVPPSAPMSLVSHPPADPSKVNEVKPAPFAAPANKQPASFEALGLALLPTEQSTTPSKSAPGSRGRSRPAARGMRRSFSSRERYQRNPGPTTDAVLPEAASPDPSPPDAPIPSAPKSAKAPAARNVDRPRDIVLHRSQGDKPSRRQGELGLTYSLAHYRSCGTRTTNPHHSNCGRTGSPCDSHRARRPDAGAAHTAIEGG